MLLSVSKTYCLRCTVAGKDHMRVQPLQNCCGRMISKAEHMPGPLLWSHGRVQKWTYEDDWGEAYWVCQSRSVCAFSAWLLALVDGGPPSVSHNTEPSNARSWFKMRSWHLTARRASCLRTGLFDCVVVQNDKAWYWYDLCLWHTCTAYMAIYDQLAT